MRFAKAHRAAPFFVAAAVVAVSVQPRGAAAQPATDVQPGAAPAIERNRQRAHCDAELRSLKQAKGLADGQSDQAFMKTCLADVDPVAVLPGSAAVMNAPVGSTGVCKDGTYSSATRRADACRARGGLAHWFGG
jgi:hypothetical protein